MEGIGGGSVKAALKETDYQAVPVFAWLGSPVNADEARATGLRGYP